MMRNYKFIVSKLSMAGLELLFFNIDLVYFVRDTEGEFNLWDYRP